MSTPLRHRRRQTARVLLFSRQCPSDPAEIFSNLAPHCQRIFHLSNRSLCHRELIPERFATGGKRSRNFAKIIRVIVDFLSFLIALIVKKLLRWDYRQAETDRSIFHTAKKVFLWRCEKAAWCRVIFNIEEINRVSWIRRFVAISLRVPDCPIENPQ